MIVIVVMMDRRDQRGDLHMGMGMGMVMAMDIAMARGRGKGARLARMHMRRCLEIRREE
jgi:hypothetical protein